VTTRHQLIAIAAILVLAGAIDFVQRIYAPRSTAIREEIFDNVALPDQPLSLASARERLQSWFPVQSSGNQEQLGDTKIEPQDLGAQVPDRADIGGWHFVLRGVFDAGPPFAVFDVRSASGGEVEQHRLLAGDVIKGVRVEQITGHSVSLSDGEKVIQLALFIIPEDDMLPKNIGSQ
jgi:hypothetical protein